jgi:BlaI family transcriptional regulator, penicillinase repressor
MEVRFTDRELDLMDVLWERGSATVPEMLEALEGDPAYTTISTLLRILEDKGYVGHTVEGRSHRYHPLVERDTAVRGALRYLTEKLARGSAGALMTHFVSDAQLTRDEMLKIRALLEEKLEEDG